MSEKSHSIVYRYSTDEKPPELFPADARLVEVDFSDEPVEDVVATIAGMFDVELEIPSELCGVRVSFRLRNPGCVDVMRSLCPAEGYELFENGRRIAICRKGVVVGQNTQEYRLPRYD